MSTCSYAQAFREAISQSCKLGLAVPDVRFTSHRYYCDDRFMPVINMIHNKMGNKDGTINLVGQCLNIHTNIRHDVELAFNCGAHLTIGYIQEPESKFFAFDYTDVAVWLKNGIDINKVDLHAWITLDSMELIDLTWPSTRAHILNCREGKGEIITKHPDDFINGTQYHPLIVSNEFPFKIGAVHGITIWCD